MLTWTLNLCPVSFKNPALNAFKWSESALLRLPGLFPEKQKCTCFVTAATAVQKLLAALWRSRSAMAESSRGKLVLLFKTAVARRHVHTRPATHPDSPQACVCV